VLCIIVVCIWESEHSEEVKNKLHLSQIFLTVLFRHGDQF
jgi:hypothetical protein